MVLVASGSYLVCWSSALVLPQGKTTTTKRPSFRTIHSLSGCKQYSSALNLFNMGKNKNKESNQRYDGSRSSSVTPSRGVLHPKTGDFVAFIGYDNDNGPTPKVGKLVQIYDTPPTSNQRRHRGDDWSCTVEELAEVKPGYYAQVRSSRMLQLNLEDVAPIADATYDVREQCYRIPIDSRTGLPKTYQDQYDLDSYQGPMMMMPGYSYQPQRDASVRSSNSNSNRYDPFAPNSGSRGANYQDFGPDGTLEKNNFYQPMAIEKATTIDRKANAVRWDPTWSQDKRVNENAPTRNVPYNPQAPTSVSDVMRKDLDYRGRRRDEPDYSYTRRQSDFGPSQNVRQPEYSYQQQQRPTYRYDPANGPNGVNNRNPNARGPTVNPNYNGMDLSPPPSASSRFSVYKQQREQQQQGRRGGYADRRTYSADRGGTRRSTIGESYDMNRGPNYGGRSRDGYSQNRPGSFAQYRQSQQQRRNQSPPPRDGRYDRGPSFNSYSRSNIFPSPASSRSNNNNRYRDNQRGGTVSLQSNDPNHGYYSRGYYSDRQEPSRATLPMQQQPPSRATLPMQQSGFMGNTRMSSYNGNNGYGYDDREQGFGDHYSSGNRYENDRYYNDNSSRRRRCEQNKLVDPARPPSQPGRIMYNRARENAENWAQVPRNFRVIPTGVGGRPR